MHFWTPQTVWGPQIPRQHDSGFGALGYTDPEGGHCPTHRQLSALLVDKELLWLTSLGHKWERVSQRTAQPLWVIPHGSKGVAVVAITKFLFKASLILCRLLHGQEVSPRSQFNRPHHSAHGIRDLK